MTEINNQVIIKEASLFPTMRSNQLDISVKTIFEDFKKFSLEDDSVKDFLPVMIDKYLLNFKYNKLNFNKEKVRKLRKFKILNKFDGPIHLVLKQVHPDTSIAKTCVDLINIYINHIIKIILDNFKNKISSKNESSNENDNESDNESDNENDNESDNEIDNGNDNESDNKSNNENDNKSETKINASCIKLDAKLIQTIIRELFPGELCKHAVSEGTKAFTKFNHNSIEELNDNKISYSNMCGLQFSVDYTMANITDYISKLDNSTNIDVDINIGAAVYLTAVIEYLTAELLETSGNMCRDMKKARVMPHHISLAIKNDSELKIFYDNVEGISLELTNLMRRTK